MKVGDLVRRVSTGYEPAIFDYDELGVGVVVEIEDRDANNFIDFDFVVMWPKHGIGWEMSDMLEVVN
jgi:hypothetical protein